MKIILGKFIKTSSKCYLRVGEAFKEVVGIKINIKGYEDVDFFAIKEQKGNLEFWNIIEGVSGCKLTTSHPSLPRVKKKVEENLSSVTRSKFEKKLSLKIKDLFVSPSYRTVANPNRIFYVAVKKDKNKGVNDPSRFRVPFHTQ